MPLLAALRAAPRSTVVAAKQVAVLHNSGLIDLHNPVRLLRTSRTIAALGPIAGAVRLSARRWGDTVAIIDAQGPVTYAELDADTDTLARRWLSDGLAEDSTIGVLCRDHRGLVSAMVAAAKVGSRLVFLNTGFAATQLADVVKREGIDALVVDAEFEVNAAHIPSDIRRLETCVASNLVSSPLRMPARQGGFVILTGGTTGTPKGVPRKVESPLAAAQFFDKVPMRHGDVVLLCAPLFHGTALSQFILSLNLGCTNILHGKFDAARALAQVSEHRVTTMVVVPTMLRRIVELDPAQLATYRTESLRIVFSAGAALPSSLGDKVISHFGPVIYNFYGCTETGTATIATPEDWIAAPGTVGRPPVGITVRLYEDNTRLVDEPNRTGTIYVGNSIAFAGYSGGGSKRVVDGLMSTGDIGHWDEGGRLFVDGRDDDMIVSGGENVFPGEVEELLYAHSRISEAAVLGVPDDEFGQRLSAFVVADDELTEIEVKSYVREHLARFKVPRDVRFVDDLPRTATGKIHRASLTEMATRSPAEHDELGGRPPRRA
ncbi:putative fatty-acid--CoA ligase [Gordonia effusa NBRC 100432]|uniref:Putative fatty-acid--CoA ligase n=1 Tax=Gordonia effusa NBRC 100432 TaxID=1077974 RepID=H0QZP8_9ACTN|nr:AMP-binding protein [Gordonia effusa]GAB18299.1 putative fatty-acid--CoA ligase [Gordonia effusa NBRC 100432]